MKGLTFTLAATCMAAPFISAAQVNRNINSYVLFAYDELVFKGGSLATGTGNIVGGNIGVNYPGTSPTGFSLAFGTSGRAVMSDGFQAVADSVRGDAAGSFYDLYANSLNPSFASTIRHLGPVSYGTPIIATPSLPVLPFTPNRSLTNSASDITVPNGGSQSFTAGVPIKDFRANDNSTVTFGAGTYDIRSLSFGSNVTVNVTDNTIFQIDRGMFTNINLKWGLGTASGSRLFLGADTYNVNTERVLNFSHGAEFHGQFFSPGGWLDIGGESELYGRFWSRRITGDPQNNVYYAVPEPITFIGLSCGLLVLLSRKRSSHKSHCSYKSYGTYETYGNY